MGVNGYQSQLRAIDQPNSCFAANVNLVPLMEQNSKYENPKITKVGITSDNSYDIVMINGQSFQIGYKTNVLQLDNVDITSMYFVQDTSSKVTIDYIAQNRDG